MSSGGDALHRLAANYLAFVQLASIRLWLRLNEFASQYSSAPAKRSQDRPAPPPRTAQGLSFPADHRSDQEHMRGGATLDLPVGRSAPAGNDKREIYFRGKI